MIALIDGDIVAYRGTGSCEPTKAKPEREPLELAIARTNELMDRIIGDVQATDYRLYFTGPDNFRYKLFPEYKANRRDKPVPLYLDSVKEYLISEWGAKIITGREADDEIGIQYRDDSIVCSTDKDLQQISGHHYNFVKYEYFFQPDLPARRVIYRQLLEGDRVDNITGIFGIGPVKASAIVDSYTDIDALHERIREMYSDEQRFSTNVRLLRILRSEEEYERMMEYIETTEREKQGEAATEVRSSEDLSTFSSINS